MGENETVNQGTTTETTEERTFTQAELNAIVQERSGRIMDKYKDYEELKAKAQKFDEIEEGNKTELQKATERADALQAKLDAMEKAASIRSIRDKVSTETGVPANLLTGETEEACAEQAKAILAFKGETGQQRSFINDKGEVRHIGKKTTRDQFAEWFNSTNKE